MAFDGIRARLGAIIGGFDAAQSHRRLRGLRASRAHVNTLIAGAGETITARARWLARNNGYGSSKGAILSFVRAMSSKLAPRGIRVNGVPPGPIWTPLIPASFPHDKVEDIGKSAPLGRPGEPNEVAPSMLFLACEDASYMTGQVLHPNGGDLIGG